MNSEILKERTKQFALRVLRVVDALPRNTKGRPIGGQLVRSGTAVGANYRAVCRSRSQVEFVAKIGVVIEEADETAFWLELIIADGLLKPKLVEPLLQEAYEIVAIMTASRKTAGRSK